MNLQNDLMRCGAKTRSGAPCASRAMPNGRCRMHGGTSVGGPVGNSNAVTHGIYRSTLTDQERTEYDGLELGGVDHELRLVRVRLARALKAELAAVNSERDYESIVDRLLGRIDTLERTRQKLVGGVDDNNSPLLIDPNPDIP